jgi:hypothetical protein
MNELKNDIKKRAELSRYLECTFLNDAAFSYFKNHKNFILNNSSLLKNWIKYSTYFTRVWINYLDDAQFEKVIEKKLKNNSINFLPYN